MPTDWQTMTDRERDAACAVIAGHRVTHNVPCMYECGANPCDMGLTDTLHRKLLPSDDDCYDPVPHYTSDWTAAMSLLDVVRGWQKRQRFYKALAVAIGVDPKSQYSFEYAIALLLGPDKRFNPAIIAECVYAAHGAGGEG